MIFKWILVGTFFAEYIGVDDGKWNHLYEWQDASRSRHRIAFRLDQKVEPYQVKAIAVECEPMFGVDEEATKNSPFFVTYTQYLCTGLGVIMSDDKKVITEEGQEEGFDFEEQMRKNAEKKKKAAEERRKANKSVLRSYRIKD